MRVPAPLAWVYNSVRRLTVGRPASEGLDGDTSGWATGLLAMLDETRKAVTALDLQRFAPTGHADALLAELLLLSTRTLSSAATLMRASFNGPIDHTEDVAVLLRRLIEVLALTIWVADEGHDREVQALRIELHATQEQRTLARDVMEHTQATDRGYSLEAVEETLERIERELRARNGTLERHHDFVSILRRHDPLLMIKYRIESNVAHGGVIGRSLQRGEEQLGEDSSPVRKRDVLSTVLVVYTALAQRCLRVMGQPDPIEALVPKIEAAIAAATVATGSDPVGLRAAD